jgi:hypothetical protein
MGPEEVEWDDRARSWRTTAVWIAGVCREDAFYSIVALRATTIVPIIPPPCSRCACPGDLGMTALLGGSYRDRHHPPVETGGWEVGKSASAAPSRAALQRHRRAFTAHRPQTQ